MSDKETPNFKLIQMDPRRTRDPELLKFLNQNFGIIDSALGSGGFPFWAGPSGSGAPFESIQEMIIAMEAVTLPQVGLILPHHYTETPIVTKPGIHLHCFTPGDYFNADDVTILDGLTYNISGGIGTINYITGLTILGQFHLTGTQANLVYVDRCRAQNGSGPALLGDNTNSISRFIASDLFANGIGGNFAMQLAGATSFDGQRGNNEFTGVNGDTCIDINASGDGMTAVNARISGRIRIQGTAGILSLRGGNIGTGAAPIIDRTGYGNTVFLNEVQCVGQAGQDLVTASSPANTTLANCVVFAGNANNVSIINDINGYTPGTSADWTGDPTRIQEALDRIAAAIGPIA